jgi:hypothetical protein
MSAGNRRGQTVVHVLYGSYDDDHDAAVTALTQHGVDVNIRAS